MFSTVPTSNTSNNFLGAGQQTNFGYHIPKVRYFCS